MYQYFGGPIIGWPQPVMPIMDYNEACGNKRHIYSLCLINGPKRINESYTSRHEAQARMYQLCKSLGLSISKVWDDKHDKTYFTDSGSEFHINRMF